MAIQANGATQMTATTCGFASNGGFVVPGSTVTAALIGYVIGPYAYNGQSYPQAQPTLIALECRSVPDDPGLRVPKSKPAELRCVPQRNAGLEHDGNDPTGPVLHATLRSGGERP